MWEWTALFNSPEVIRAQDLSDHASRSLDAYHELNEARRSGDVQRILIAEKAVAVVLAPAVDFFTVIIRHARLRAGSISDSADKSAADLPQT